MRGDDFLAPRAWPPDPGENQAESPPPSHSAVGLAFRRSILCECQAQDTPQTATQPWRGQHDWAGNVIREQAPLYKAPGFRDFIGVFRARVAKQKPVLAAIMYHGQIPMEEQPKLSKPNAWSDPTRGLP
jgi:hypothetical protein